MSTDFSFDERVVRLYNQSRAHPADVSQQIGAAIAAQVPGDKRVLEIGVGTGRIGWPVAAAGCDVIGFDLSAHMLGEVHRTRPAQISGSLALTRADMHHLPFPDNCFDAVMATHVLHLATDWQAVLREVVRVLKPDGLLIEGSDWKDPQSVIARIQQEVRMQAVRLDPSLMPPAAGVSRTDFLVQLGATGNESLIAAEWVIHMSAAERLEAVEARVDSESWIFTDALFEQITTHLRDFAAQQWPDLHAQQAITRRFMLSITRGNWR